MDSLDSLEYKGAAIATNDWKLHRGTITKQISTKVVSTIDAGTNTLTSNAHGFTDTQLVRVGVIGGNMPAPLLKTDRYQIFTAATNTFKLKDEAGAAEIDITGVGTGSIIVWRADAGFDDPEQGLPTFIPEINTTLSGIAYVEGMLTVGQSNATDPPDWDDFRIIGTGRRLMDYDFAGNEIGVIADKEFLSNLALQVVDNFLVNYSGKPERIDWLSWRSFRQDCDKLVWQRVISIDDETPPTTESGFTGRYYAGSAFETLVLTRQDSTINFPSNSVTPGPGVPPDAFSIRWTATLKAKFSELTTFELFHDFGAKMWIDGNLIIDQWGINGTHSAAYTLVQDQFYAITIEMEDHGMPWGCVFRWSSASLPIEVVPASSAAPSDVLVKRYENHAAFPIAVEANEVHHRLMERAPGWDWTDDEGLIKFLPPDRPISFAFKFDRMDDDIAPNFIKQTFSKKRRPMLDRPNFLLFRFRDALLTGYPFHYVQADREELRLFTNGEPTNNPAQDLGVMTRSLAERLAEMEMVLKSDPSYVIGIDGGRRTGKIRKNHFVTVEYIDTANNTVVNDKLMATFHAWGASNGRNNFSLLPIPDPYYSDEVFNWTTQDLASNVALWKASAITGHADLAPISTWEDIEGVFDATGVGTSRPLYRTNGGEPYVEFDGSNDYLATGLNTAFGDFAALVVFRPRAMATATRILDKDFTTGFWVGVNPSDAGEIGGGILEGAPPYGHFLDIVNDTWYALLIQRSGTTKTIRMGGLSSTETVSATALDTTALTIGSVLGGGANFAHMDVKEISIMNDNVAGNDLTNLEAYVLQEYGLVL